MSLSVYVHIPYCLQRCRYCDFTTFEQGTILPTDQYVKWVQHEIEYRSHLVGPQYLTSIYFGGGTPSLLPAEAIISILESLAGSGFTWDQRTEVTLEINPATVDEGKLSRLIEKGFNRLSVGAQSFSDELLRLCGRRHTAEDTRNTLRLIQRMGVRYSFDLLFALPGQTLGQLEQDLDEVVSFAPEHLSAYCLTVPEGHPMNQNRPKEEIQVEMFGRIERRLSEIGLLKYEISNFARPGSESVHNLGYWTGRPYWGLGVSAHSYLPVGKFGLRFWNAKDLNEYGRQALQDYRHERDWLRVLPSRQLEALSETEALTDFAHTRLRMTKGMPDNAALQSEFSSRATTLLSLRLQRLKEKGLIGLEEGHWRLTNEGQLLSNLAFEEMTFLESDLGGAGLPLQ